MGNPGTAVPFAWPTADVISWPWVAFPTGPDGFAACGAHLWACTEGSGSPAAPPTTESRVENQRHVSPSPQFQPKRFAGALES